MSTKINVKTHFVPSCSEQNFELKYQGVLFQPAHWYVGVDFLEDNDFMTASIHEFAFVTKPSRKQISNCIREGLNEHSIDINKFKRDYENYSLTEE